MAAETNNTQSIPTSNNAVATDTNPADSIPTLDNGVASESLVVEEHLDSELEVSHKPVNDSQQDVLKRKEHKWHRGFELAFDTLKQRFLEFANDVIDSNEGFPGPSDKPDPIYPLTVDESHRNEQAPTKDRNPGENEGTRYESAKENDANVLYRSDIYYYDRGDKKPYFGKSIQNKNPIRTILTRDRAESFKQCVFEITAMYAVPSISPYTLEPSDLEDGTLQPIKVSAECGIYITIQSKYVLDILRDVVLYPRSLLPHATKLVLLEPFCMLLHHRVELAERRDELKQAVSELASPETNAPSTAHEHLACLTDFIHQRYDDALSRETARHRETHAMCTYEWVWLLFRPGSIVYAWDYNILRVYTVEEHDRGKSESGETRPQPLYADDEGRLSRPAQLRVLVWTIDFDGRRLGRRRTSVSIPAFDGEMSILSLPIFPKEYLKYDKRVHHELSTEEFLTQRGKLFLEMARKGYREYHGETVTEPRRTIRGRVVIDTKAYYDANDSRQPQLGLTTRDQDNSFEEGCMCPDCRAKRIIKGQSDSADPYSHYDDIDPYKCESLEPEQYLICSYKLKRHGDERADFINRNCDPAAVSSLDVQNHYNVIWRTLDPNCSTTIAPTVEDAVNLARQIGKHGMQTLITGSFHLVGGALFLLEPEVPY